MRERERGGRERERERERHTHTHTHARTHARTHACTHARRERDGEKQRRWRDGYREKEGGRERGREWEGERQRDSSGLICDCLAHINIHNTIGYARIIHTKALISMHCQSHEISAEKQRTQIIFLKERGGEVWE